MSNQVLYKIDHEKRRPGITLLFKDIQEKYPHMSYDQILAKAKELWHELCKEEKT